MPNFAKEKKVLIENFFSLSFLQIANYILPLITIPYLVRVLGPEKFGLIMFAQAFVQYFMVFTDYGFNLSATRKISIHRDDKERVSGLFSAVTLIKLVFFAAAFCVFSMMVFSFGKFREFWFVYMFSFGVVAGNILFPVWFFQGLERMKYITLINLIIKFIFTVSIFIFVKNEGDYLYVPVINSCGFIIAGIFSLRVLWKHFEVRPKMPSFAVIMEEVKDGWYVFISTIAISLYTTTNTFLLGLFTDNVVVGYYSAAEKIINIVQGMYMPVSQSVYPYISKMANESRDRAVRFLKKAGYLMGVITLATSTFIFIFARAIVNIILGPQYGQSIVVLRILAFIPFIVGVATIYARFFLLGFGYLKELSRIIMICSIISLALAFTLIHAFSLNEIGAAITWLTVECFVLMFSYLSYRKLAVCR